MFHYVATHIWWAGFSWEAFAALVTGAAAVAGAVFIGREQVKISRRQAAIAERQTAIQEQTLRAKYVRGSFIGGPDYLPVAR